MPQTIHVRTLADDDEIKRRKYAVIYWSFIFKWIIPILIIIVSLATKSVTFTWIGIIWLFLSFLPKIRRLIRNSNKKKNQISLFSLKTLVIYGITFAIGLWISTIIMPFIKTTNLIVIYLITGFFLELSAKICQMFLYGKPRITIDKWFILWVLIHSVVVYGVLYLIGKIAIQNQYLLFLTVGFGIAVITHIIWRFLYKE